MVDDGSLAHIYLSDILFRVLLSSLTLTTVVIALPPSTVQSTQRTDTLRYVQYAW